jgi:hypothetical protein
VQRPWGGSVPISYSAGTGSQGLFLDKHFLPLLTSAILGSHTSTVSPGALFLFLTSGKVAK